MCHKFTICRTWTLRYIFFDTHCYFIVCASLWIMIFYFKFFSNSIECLFLIFRKFIFPCGYFGYLSIILFNSKDEDDQFLPCLRVKSYLLSSLLHWSTCGKNLNVVKCWRDMICHWMIMDGYVFTWNCQLYTT